MLADTIAGRATPLKTDIASVPKTDENAQVPAWGGPFFDANGTVDSTIAYALPVAQQSQAVKIYNATREWGVYSHGAMISFSGGVFVATWKNAVLSEDTPGQRVLWSWATADAPLNYSKPAVLFPNVSVSTHAVSTT